MKRKPVYIIAEAGVNHNGDLGLAKALVKAAADAKADAVKFQTFNAERLARSSAPKAEYQLKSSPQSESQLEMLRALELPEEWHFELKALAESLGIDFLSTAFEQQSLAFLTSLDMRLFKVPSGELTNLPLLWQFARTGKPLILSTGMATLSEVEQALAVVAHGRGNTTEPQTLDEVWQYWSHGDHRTAHTRELTLLHCTSQYPTPPEQVNLLAMDTLSQAFGLPVGYSDHTEGGLVSIAAVSRGACVVEKHFTLDRSMPGPDHKSSLEPQELKQMVRDIRTLERCFGDGAKAPQAVEWDTRQAARQQVVAARDIPNGAVIKREDLTAARCGSGLPAAQLWDLVGQVARDDYKAGDIIKS